MCYGIEAGLAEQSRYFALVSHLSIVIHPHQHKITLNSHESRMQILWRTLILDEFQGTSPAVMEIGTLFPLFIKWLLVATTNHHTKEGKSESAHQLSEVDLHHYVERLICSLETLVSLDEMDATFIPGSAQLRAILKTRNVYQDVNADNGVASPGLEGLALDSVPSVDATQSSPPIRPLHGLWDQSSKTSIAEALEKSFISAFIPQMQATMARLRYSTLGLTQASVLPSDEVCFLHGASAPVFLRPTSGSRYRFLGDAYVHGFMKGDATSIIGELTTIILG